MISTEHFLEKISSQEFQIPIEANFIIGIDKLEKIVEKLSTDVILQQIFAINNSFSKNKLLNFRSYLEGVQDDVFFATGMSFPGEEISGSRAGLASSSTGLHGDILSAPVLKGRKDLANFQISFLETNESVIDNVLRPWVIATSHFGLFARKNNLQNFKTNVTAIFLDKFTQDKDRESARRKIITFYNAVPLSVASYDVEYGSKNVGKRTTKTTWTYSYYSVS